MTFTETVVLDLKEAPNTKELIHRFQYDVLHHNERTCTTITPVESFQIRISAHAEHIRFEDFKKVVDKLEQFAKELKGHAKLWETFEMLNLTKQTEKRS